MSTDGEAAMDQWGRIDALVNNAATGQPDGRFEGDPDDFKSF